MATFRCGGCGEKVRNVEQQFVLTYPMMCSHLTCNNKNNWSLIKEESKFVDWQRCKVQENSDEVRLPALTVGVAPRNVQITDGRQCSALLVLIGRTTLVTCSLARNRALMLLH